jgi:hypothetical protein
MLISKLLVVLQQLAKRLSVSLDIAKVILETAKKYDMQAALSGAVDLMIALSQFLSNHAIELYTLFCFVSSDRRIMFRSQLPDARDIRFRMTQPCVYLWFAKHHWL